MKVIQSHVGIKQQKKPGGLTLMDLGNRKKYHRDEEIGFLESASRQDTIIEKIKVSLDEMDPGSKKRSNPAALSQFNQFPSQFWPAGKYLKESHQPRRTRAGADEISTVYIVA